MITYFVYKSLTTETQRNGEKKTIKKFRKLCDSVVIINVFGHLSGGETPVPFPTRQLSPPAPIVQISPNEVVCIVYNLEVLKDKSLFAKFGTKVLYHLTIEMSNVLLSWKNS